MNSTEEQAPLINSVDAAQSPLESGHQKRSGKRRNRNRNRHRRRHSAKPHLTPHSRPQETEGTQLSQARQNHSTYDRTLHHRSQGGTGYGMRRDYQSTEAELSGENIPKSLLPSYAENLRRIGRLPPEQSDLVETPPETEPTPRTEAEQQAWEEQQMREAHEQDQRMDAKN